MKTSGEYRFGIGVPTLLMLCAILALTTLGILTYASGRANLSLTDRTVDLTVRYYEAAARAQEALARLDADLAVMRKTADGEDAYQALLAAYADDNGMAREGMTLSFEIDAGGARKLSLAAAVAPLSQTSDRYTLVRHQLIGDDLIEEEQILNVYH